MATTIGVKMQMDGAAQFKADLQQITQKSKELAAEMKAAASGADNEADKQRILAAQIENASKKIDQLNKKYDAQKSALDQTNAELEEAKKAYGEDSQEVQQLTLAVTKQETALSKTKTEINKATAELNKFESEADQAADETEDLAEAEKKADDASAQLKGGFSVLKGAVADLVADGLRKAVDAFKDLITAGPEFADQIQTLAQQTGVATDTLQEFEYMSGLIDVDVSTIAGSMKKLTKSMSSARGGPGATAEAFAQLGISVTDANGELRDNEEVFYEAIDALGKVENETERDALAMQLFGKSATDLNPLIEAGSDAMRAFADEAHEMGYVLDGDSLEALGNVQDAFDRFNKKMEAVKNQIAAQLAPAIERGMKRVQEVIDGIDWKKVGQKMGDAFNKVIDAFEWLLEHGEVVKSAIVGIIAAMAAQKVMTFVQSMQGMVTAVKAAVAAVKSLTAAMNSNPIMLMVTAIAAAGVALIAWQKSVLDAKDAMNPLHQELDELRTAVDEHVTAVNESITAYNDLKAAREESVSNGMAEMSYIQKLNDELSTLVDENGNVEESDRSRAQFILSELNGALGTEYTMTGNIIQNYKDMEQSVAACIAQKKAEIILSAQEEAYRQAIVNRDQAEAALAETVALQVERTNERAEAEARFNEVMAEVSAGNIEHMGELTDLNTKMQELDTEIATLNDSYTAQADLVDQYAYDMASYTDNMTAALNGDYDQIEYKSWETAKAQGEASNSASQEITKNAKDSSTEWLKQLSQLVSDSSGKNVEFKDVGNGMVEMYVDGIKQGDDLPANQVKTMAGMALKEADISMEMTQSGAYAVSGFVNGVEVNTWMASGAGRTMADAFINAFKQRMDEGSPSKVMAKSGLNAVLGFTNEIRDDLQMVSTAGQTMAAAFTNSFNPNTNYGAMMNGLSSGVNVSTGGFGSMSNSIVMNIYGADGQNVNALADAVIDRLQRTILGSEAVYA